MSSSIWTIPPIKAAGEDESSTPRFGLSIHRPSKGYRIITGWAKLRKIYFQIKFSKPMVSSYLTDGGRKHENTAVINGTNLRAAFTFANKDRHPLVAKVALSPVSIDNARQNMQKEAAGWDSTICDPSRCIMGERAQSDSDQRYPSPERNFLHRLIPYDDPAQYNVGCKRRVYGSRLFNPKGWSQ